MCIYFCFQGRANVQSFDILFLNHIYKFQYFSIWPHRIFSELNMTHLTNDKIKIEFKALNEISALRMKTYIDLAKL